MSITSVSPATIRKVVNYLEQELGVSVYGGFKDLENLVEGAGCRDYSAEDIIKLRKLLMNGAEFTQEDY